MRKLYTSDIQNIVIKVGTSILTKNGVFDKRLIESLADEIAQLLKKGVFVSIVSSGAIGSGMIILKQKQRPQTMEGLQAAAAIGQRYLMQCYEESFAKYGYTTAQVLLTWEDLSEQKRFMNAKRTLKEIQRLGAIPIINENDTVATEEIKFGDNDKLSALMAILLETDLLIILSDTNGIYQDAQIGEKSRLVLVERIDDSLFRHAKDGETCFTVGGMKSKLKAIQMCTSAGIPAFLACGRLPHIMTKIFQGEDVGTFFMPQLKKMEAKSSWYIHFQNHIRGRAQK